MAVSEQLANAAVARFPAVACSRGHYESFYLKASDPQRPRAVWIRYTVLKHPAQPPRGSLWFTLWAGDGAPLTTKLTLDGAQLQAGGAELIQIGDSGLSTGRVRGRANGASWDLSIGDGAPGLAHLPYRWMYSAPLPRTKALSLHPRALCSGEVAFEGQSLSLDAWPAMLGHNWGSEHAERWVWLHGAGFPDAPGAWLDLIIGRVRAGPILLPWIANGALELDGRRHRLGGPAALVSTRVDAGPARCDFAFSGAGVRVRGSAVNPTGMPVGWRYSDPDGPGHFVTNCSVASLALEVTGAGSGPGTRRLQLDAGAAYELGAREQPVGVEILGFADP